MKAPQNVGERYMSFFRNDPAGVFLMQELESLKKRKLESAMTNNSLDQLSQAKGVDDALGIIQSVLNQEDRKAAKLKE